MYRPLIGLTMGDVAGIGPEIAVKALQDQTFLSICRLVVLGDRSALLNAMEHLGGKLDLKEVSSRDELRAVDDDLLFYPLTNDVGRRVRTGTISKDAGKAAGLYIETAAGLAMEGVIDGVVTGPIHKEGLRLAGYPFPGHTEFFAYLTRASDYVMMLAGDRLRVTLVTIHCPLREVPARLSVESIRRTMDITYRGIERDFGIDRPRLAVAGLNPHAGEGGLFGDEEIHIIMPAIEKAREAGINADGPLSPDTVFVQAARGRYDAVVCMYHDQGLIPLKLLHFSDGINVTLGLPIVRTSVDHGTAYDIAGTGKADPRSLIRAVKAAALMAENRKKAGFAVHGCR